MEQITNSSKHLQTSSNQFDLRVSKKVAEATDQEIQTHLAYIMVLIGIPLTKYPIETEKKIMINYIKLNWHYEELEVMKKAFEWAIEKRPKDNKGNDIITLYDRPFNIEYIRSIIIRYKSTKQLEINKQTPQSEGMSNHKRAEGIIGIIAKQNPELYEKLKNIGKEKPKPQPEQQKQTQEIKGIFKIYEDEYNKLWNIQARESLGSPFVKYKGNTLSFSEYCNFRYEEEHLSIEEDIDEETE